MAVKLENKTNVLAPNATYPYGNIKDKTESLPGTPVNTATYADLHQFFAKMLDVSGVIANGLPENADNGFQYYTALLAVISGMTPAIVNANNSAGIIETENNVVLKTKIIEIGAWDMDATASLNVAHGIGDRTKIYSVFATINSDGGARYNLHSVDSSAGASNGGVAEITDANIQLVRTDLGFYDTGGFNDTGASRGQLLITYSL